MFQSIQRRKQPVYVLDPDFEYTKQNVHNVPWWCGVLAIVAILLLGYGSQLSLNQLPKALTLADVEHNPDKFISERAWRDLKILNDFGPRPTGSNANEVLAVDFLKREINFIQQNSNSNQKIVSDIQIVSGSYYAGFRPHGMTNVYRNVQNVVVKLLGQYERNGNSNQTLMLNCHFDSVAGSPGASDDAASCCVMLEILRVLSKQTYVNRHTILFLFNGAEETPLQASHGFITQHNWAKDIKAFINLESVGSAGKEILFQSGPNHPWLMKYYSLVPHPFAQAGAEEVFHLGLIPSDTDFRIFRDYGKIPGMDFAHIVNGYRYHTKYDNIDYISFEVLQRTGENMLLLTKEIANSDELLDTEKHSKGSLVYFDFLGIFFIFYSKSIGNILNIVIVVVSTTFPFLSLSRSTKGVQTKYLKSEIRIGSIATTLSIILSVGVCYGLAVLNDFLDKSMTWFGNPYLTIGLYCCPALIVQCMVHVVINKILGNKKAPLSLALKIQAQQNGTNLFWGSLVIFLTFSGYRVGYVGTVILLFTLISNLIIGTLRMQNTVNKWLYVHIVFQIFVVLWTWYLFHIILNVFIPLTGRVGALKNPDITIGMICAAFTFYITSYLTQLVLLLKNKRNYFGFLFLLFIVTQFVIIFTKLGFPYRDDFHAAPKLQRHFIVHTKRTFYDQNNAIRYADTGFWLREMDRNAKKTIESLATPDIPIPQLENKMCEKEVFCGIPLYSCRQLHVGGFWLPGPGPIIRDIAEIKLNSRSKLSDYETRLNFTLFGDVLLSFLIRPKPGITLQNWDILPEVPEPNEFNDQKGYFVMITHGVNSEPMNVTLDFKYDNIDYDGPLADITLITTHWEYHKEHTGAFIQLLLRVPKWAFAVPSVAALNAYTF